MNQIPFKIGRTRASFFTKVQKCKLAAGIDILVKALESKYFADEILQFEWTNQENRRFYRFYHASGLSNRQVLHRIRGYQAYFNELGNNEQLIILPFNSRKEIQNYNARTNSIVWLSLNCIQNDWYTPIHIASAIAHELAIAVGLDSSLHQISRPEYHTNKVPEFVGNLVMKTASLWEENVTDVKNAFSQIDKNQYNYFAASEVLGNLGNKEIQHSQSNFENLISSLLKEQETLFTLQENLTVSETARLVCIEEVLLKLVKLKSRLAKSTLDGSGLDFHKSKPITEARRGNA